MNGDYLKLLREENNLSQEDVADKLDVNRQTVSNWENGKTKKLSSAFIAQLADCYGISERDFRIKLYEAAPAFQEEINDDVVDETAYAKENTKRPKKQKNVIRSLAITLAIGTFISCVITALLCFIIISGYIPSSMPKGSLGTNYHQSASFTDIFCTFCFFWLICAALPVLIHAIILFIKKLVKKENQQ